VPAEKALLFQTDLNHFWEIVTNDNSEARFAALHTLDDLLLCEVVRFGVFNKQEMIGPLASIYRTFAMKMPEDQRYAIYRHVAGFVEHTSIVSVNAFLPFIAEDNARAIVGTAVINFLSLGPLTDSDPMSRVKYIIGMIERNLLENEGAAFGALLHIGDKRVCDLLNSVRDRLDRDAINNAVNCSAGFIHSSTVDFYLDWLEGMKGNDEDSTFGIVASGLGLLKKRSQIDQIYTGHRPFPTRSVTPEQWKASLKPIALTEYIQQVSGRMYALERAEPSPRIMPHVLTEWGLKPLTDCTETVVLDDRAATRTFHLRPEPIPSGRIVDVSNPPTSSPGRASTETSNPATTL
jgi:hypothetical protein